MSHLLLFLVLVTKLVVKAEKLYPRFAGNNLINTCLAKWFDKVKAAYDGRLFDQVQINNG